LDVGVWVRVQQTPPATAACSSECIFLAISCIRYGTNGGLASKQPRAGAKFGEKKDPTLPKGPSTSSKAWGGGVGCGMWGVVCGVWGLGLGAWALEFGFSVF
jgi:hypothetical protein